jgi:hypothetical protein
MQNKFDICVLRWETVNLKFKRMKKVFMIMAVAVMAGYFSLAVIGRIHFERSGDEN